MKATMSHPSDRDTLWKLIKDIRFGMLTHRHADGSLQGHPLTTQNTPEDEATTLYFFISAKSEMASRLKEDGQVNVSYADPGADRYVSIAGNARISADQDLKERLWSALARAWFPGGVNDPDLAVVEVQIHHAEYWNVTDSKVTQLFKMTKAALTGDVPHHLAEHKELDLS